MPEALPRAAQPEYLTDALLCAGALGAGRVCHVVVESSKSTILSRIVRLRLSHDGAAQETPAALILKTGYRTRRVALELGPQGGRVLHADCYRDVGASGPTLLCRRLARRHERLAPAARRSDRHTFYACLVADAADSRTE
jgi:hypothetical protein